jgi:hypothetical protein
MGRKLFLVGTLIAVTLFTISITPASALDYRNIGPYRILIHVWPAPYEVGETKVVNIAVLKDGQDLTGLEDSITVTISRGSWYTGVVEKLAIASTCEGSWPQTYHTYTTYPFELTETGVYLIYVEVDIEKKPGHTLTLRACFSIEVIDWKEKYMKLLNEYCELKHQYFELLDEVDRLRKILCIGLGVVIGVLIATYSKWRRKV